MTFEIEVNGRVRRVAVDGVDAAGPAGGRFRVMVDDHVQELTAVPTAYTAPFAGPTSAVPVR